MAYAYQKKKNGKRCGPYYVGWIDENGRPRQEKSKEKTKKAAEAEAHERERLAKRIRDGLERARPERITFGEMTQRYLDTEAKSQDSFATINQRVRDHILPTLKDMWLDEVTPADVQRLLNAKEKEGYAEQTREHIRMHCSAIFTYAIEREKYPLPGNIILDVPKVVVPEREIIYVPDEYIPRIIANVHGRSRELFATAVYTGIRKGELFALPKTAPDLQRRLIVVAKSHGRKSTKSKKLRYVPIPLELVPFLEAQLAKPEVQASEYLFPDTSGGRRGEKEDLANLFKTALKRAGLVERWDHICRKCGHQEEQQTDQPKRCPQCNRMLLWPRPVPLPYTFKHLRSTYGTYATEHTNDLRFTQKALGHSDINVTDKHYAKVRASKLVEQIDGLSFGTYPALTGPMFPASTSKTPEQLSEELQYVTATRSRGLEPLTSGVTGQSRTFPRLSHSSSGIGNSSTSEGEDPPIGETRIAAPTPATYPALTDTFSVSEVAEVLSLTPSAVYLAIKRGDLPAVRLGSGVRVRSADLDAFITKSKSTPPEGE